MITSDAEIVRITRLKAAGMLGDNFWHRELIVAEAPLVRSAEAGGAGFLGQAQQSKGGKKANGLGVAPGTNAAFREVLQLEEGLLASVTEGQVGATLCRRHCRAQCHVTQAEARCV